MKKYNSYKYIYILILRMNIFKKIWILNVFRDLFLKILDRIILIRKKIFSNLIWINWNQFNQNEFITHCI